MQIDGKTNIDQRIAGAFKAASEATGTSFDYLVATSQRESDHRPDLAAATSSAKGLFQFVDQTWFDLVKREGPALGLDGLAARITADGKGGWTVADPTERARILALRTDPLVSSVMAGRFTETNRSQLGASLGRAPTDGELYAAHVLGAAGAARLIGMAGSEPGTTAAVAFPKAAAANPGLFYGKDGGSRTVAELLSRLTRNPSAPPAADAGGRIAEAHAALAATAKTRADPGTLALLLRAQAAAVVAKEPPPTTSATTFGAADGAEARYARTALAATGLPGAQTGSTPPRGGGPTGWRAAAPSDAFSALMRSDAASEGDAAAAAALAPNALPAVAAPSAALVGAIGHTAGGGSGGIPYIDPYAPMALAAPGPDAPPLVLPAGARPSRVVDRAAIGSPAMPLPLVDPAVAGPRPSRVLFSAPPAGTLAVDEEAAGVAQDAVRVHTVAITPPAAATAGAAPTVAGAAPVAPTRPTAADTAAEPEAAGRGQAPVRRARRPLDLTAAARGAERNR